jgi:hypothetical protein
LASKIWHCRKPIAGTIAETYLRSRGIVCALPTTLGFLPAHGPNPPAMIAAYALADEPEPGILGDPHKVGSIHLTDLLPDGSGRKSGKGAKRTIGSPKRKIKIDEKDIEIGIPIVLAPLNDLFGLAICEGIENGFIIHQATGFGIWVAGSAPYLPALAEAIPHDVEAVTICADDDDAGRKAAHELAEKLYLRSQRSIDRGGFLRGKIEIRIGGLS